MIKRIGIATNDKTGNSTICRVDLEDELKITVRYIR
jgi:hypothetical protein